MKNAFRYIALLIVATAATAAPLHAQFGIKLPKIGQPQATPTPQATPAPRASTGGGGGQIVQPTPAPKSTAGGGGLLPARPQATESPVLLPATLDIRCDHENRYWKLPNESNYASWIPTVKFQVFYKSQIKLRLQAEYFTPDGKSWFTEQLQTNKMDGVEQTTEIISSRDGDRFTNRSTIATGAFGVKITDTRDGAVLFEGKFKVAKFKYGPEIPMFKNQYGFYVEQDWNMPIGWVWLDYASSTSSPPVRVGVWFKGESRAGEYEARLFYNDQMIATTDGQGTVENRESRYCNVIEKKEFSYWQRWDFTWYKVGFRALNTANPPFSNAAPGEYTVKIFYKSVQVREVKFSVADGNLVDTGIAAGSGISGRQIIVPVKILPSAEKFNAAAWKTDAFYGHPLTGFTLP